MSEKQPEIAANPETDQVDGSQLRPHPDMSINGDLQPKEAEHTHHEAASVKNQKLLETEPLNEESHQVPADLAAVADVSDGQTNVQSAVRQLSDGDGNKRRGRVENPEGSGVFELRPVEGPVTDLRRERDPIEDIGSGKAAYFVVHDNRGLVDVHCEKSGAGERDPTTCGQSISHDSLEKDPRQPGVSKGRRRTCSGDDGLVTNNSSSDPEQGYNSDSLLLPDARKKGRSHVQPVLGKGRRSTVWYVQPAPEGRDIFEAGGDESQNPRLSTMSGVVHDGSDRIERLAVESCVEESPMVETTPVTSNATSEDWSDREGRVCNPVFRCACTMCRRLKGQFAKAPLFYVLSVIIVVFAVVAFSFNDENLDILVCLLTTVGFCVLLTVAVPRGTWSKSGEKLEGSGLFSGGSSGVCGECCGRREPTPLPEGRRHSQYYHPLEEDVHTVFEHEIADVSNIDPKDCPQMRMVEEQETVKSESPDSPPDFHQLNVDIHAPATPRNSEEARKQGAAKKLANTRKKGKSAPLKDAEQVPQPEDRLNADLSRNIPEASATLRSTLTSLIAETAATLDVKEFVCEHDGQGVACSCFADSCKRGDGSGKF